MKSVKVSDWYDTNTPNYKVPMYVCEVVIRGKKYTYTGITPAEVMDKIEYESISRVGWKKGRWPTADYTQWKEIYAEYDKRVAQWDKECES